MMGAAMGNNLNRSRARASERLAKANANTAVGSESDAVIAAELDALLERLEDQAAAQKAEMAKILSRLRATRLPA